MLVPKVCTFFFFVIFWLVIRCRGDTAEGSRLLEEAFRDYDKRVRPSYGGLPVSVNVSMHILSISEVDTLRKTYTISFYVRQTWIDPRLSFNSRRNIDTITLDAGTAERIWTPDTFYVNEVSSSSHSSPLKNQFCRISQDGSVLFSKRVTLTAFSPMRTNLFPYDTHKLGLDLESYGSQTKDLMYNWTSEAITISGFNPPGFLITEFNGTTNLKVTSTGSYSILSIEVTVRRVSLPYELGILIPTCILLILCLCTISIKKPNVAVVVVIYLLSLIAILHGMLLLNGIGSTSRGGTNAPIMTPLHIYLILAFGFGIVCLMVNIIREQNSKENGTDASGEQEENKSRTESTSENCRTDELRTATVVNSLDNSNCSSDGSTKNWRRILQWRKFTETLWSEDCIRCSLWTLLFSIHLFFLVIFRNIP